MRRVRELAYFLASSNRITVKLFVTAAPDPAAATPYSLSCGHIGQGAGRLGGAAMQSAGPEMRRFTEPGDASYAMQSLCLHRVPLGNGPYAATLTYIRMEEAALHLFRSSSFFALAESEVDSIVLQLPF